MQRRHFLLKGGAAAIGLAAGRYHEAFADTRLRVGLVGTGWYGKSVLFRLVQVAPVEIVSLCDVDKAMLDEAAQMAAARQVSKKTPRLYGDYRKMLAERDLDLVIVSTPDHWHALPMIEAVKSGADVYVEKPISVDVVEGQAMVRAARKHGRVVQVNTQRRSTPHLIEAREEIIKSGRLGRVGQVEIYSYFGGRSGNVKTLEPPATLDWNFWSGPAPLLPYNEIVHPRGWRAFMAYGNGKLGDLCIHMLDMVRFMLDLGMPKRISSSGGQFQGAGGAIDITDTQTAIFDYGDLQVIWNHRAWGQPPNKKHPWAATLYGENGVLTAGVNGYEFTPYDGKPAVVRDVALELDQYPEDRTEKDLEKHVAPAIRAHLRNALECMKTRARPVADIEQGHISSSACILANVALTLGRTLEWDQAKGQVVGDDEANRLLRRPYRSPWVHPEPSDFA
jgi:predicted dehydrogenase